MIRLEWVHAKAASDRWLEENHLLREELGRIALSFRWSYEDWSSCEAVLVQGAEDCTALGLKAFCLRSAYHYGQLVSNALGNIKRAGLPIPFQSL